MQYEAWSDGRSSVGVKFESAFQRQSAVVRIVKPSQEPAVTPTHNGGAKGDKTGFNPLTEGRLALSGSSPPEQSSKEVCHALSLCNTET